MHVHNMLMGLSAHASANTAVKILHLCHSLNDNSQNTFQQKNVYEFLCHAMCCAMRRSPSMVSYAMIYYTHECVIITEQKLIYIVIYFCCMLILVTYIRLEALVLPTTL